MPAVTVAIPAFKPRHLPEAIQSVLSQTFEDFELLISDDLGDGSIAAIVSRFDDPRIRLLEGPRQGLVPNSAFLWEQARTDLLKFLYDDDLLYPEALEKLHAAIHWQSGFAYAFSRREFIDDAGAVIRRLPGFAGDEWVWFEPDVIPRYMLERLINPVGEPSNVLIRRSAFAGSECLTQYAGVPIRHLIDATFYMNAGTAGPCVALPDYLAAFRIHGAQVSSRTSEPAFSRAMYEWEVLLRGGVQSALIPMESAIKSVETLAKVYRQYGAGRPEIALFMSRLPQLRQQFDAGDRAVLNDRFRADLAAAETLIAVRAAAPLTSP